MAPASTQGSAGFRYCRKHRKRRCSHNERVLPRSVLEVGDAVRAVLAHRRVGGVAVILARDPLGGVQGQGGRFRVRIGGRGQPISGVEGVAPGSRRGMGHAGAAIGVVEAVADRAVGLRDLRAAVGVVECPARGARAVGHSRFAPCRVVGQADIGIVGIIDTRQPPV